MGFFFGSAGIDAVDLGCLGNSIAVHLDGAQGGGGVGGEERVAGAGGEDDHAAAFQVIERAVADVGLSQTVGIGIADSTRAGVFSRLERALPGRARS